MRLTEDNKQFGRSNANPMEETHQLALTIFGSEEKANRWLHEPKSRFGDRTP